MKAIILERFGEPTEVLRLGEVPTPEPGPGEVRVRMLASPVNPSDVMVIRGRYGILPDPPALLGFEGVGVVDRAGSGFLGRLVLGKRVTVINGKGGNWAEYAVIPARQARPMPDDIPDEQAASYFVNPATALAMVRHVLKIPRGEFLLQTAAGSALGRMIIRLARHDGIKTINVVRRREAVEELKAIGGDIVLSSADGPIDEQVRRAVGPEGVRFAIDPVGGQTGTEVFQALAADARMLVYGSLSGEPLRVEPRRMIAGHRIVEGFWLGHWMRERSIPAALLLFREIAQLIRAGILTTEIGGVYPLDEFLAAIRESETVGHRGKVILRIGSR
jgi:NADPH:quinone reductase-like Zn-dependent oxidoreductase